MYIIAENIHIIAPPVRAAIEAKDGAYIRSFISRLVDAGANVIDLNIGPSRRNGSEVLSWLVREAESVTDLPLCFDTTNLAAIEAACRVVTKAQPIINSTDCKADRLEQVPLIAKQYGTRLVGLTMAEGMIPVSADERVTLALERLIPRMLEIDFPMTDLIIDPLVLTVSGCQHYCPEFIEAVRMLKVSWDPPPLTNGGLSNVSNAVPREMRPLINRVYMVMMIAAGVDMVIADPLDEELREFIRVVETRDDSTPVNRLLLTLYDRVVAMEELLPEDIDMADPVQAGIWQTVQVLLNRVIYTDAYLR
jgi:5-methyltetrahydrofolate corrinoid/iron sulfur protein methyltransferase